MIIIKIIVWILALASSLLWITKLITDCVSSIYGGPIPDETATNDALTRLYLIGIISLLWSIIICTF